MLHAIVSAVALGVISLLGDYVWAAMQLRHRMTSGLVHGAVICLCIGAAIGVREGRLARAVAFGPIIGVLAADFSTRWCRRCATPRCFQRGCSSGSVSRCCSRTCGATARLSLAVARGVAAAILSGAAFYAISGIWTRPSPGGPDYLRNLWSWTVAFLPGFLALFLFSTPREFTTRVHDEGS